MELNIFLDGLAESHPLAKAEEYQSPPAFVMLALKDSIKVACGVYGDGGAGFGSGGTTIVPSLITLTPSSSDSKISPEVFEVPKATDGARIKAQPA